MRSAPSKQAVLSQGPDITSPGAFDDQAGASSIAGSPAPTAVFVSYPYEWPAEMLYSAGRFFLDAAEVALQKGLTFSCATPRDICFAGPHPFFLKPPPLRRASGASFGPIYDAFRRNFVFPLLIDKDLGINAPAVLLSHRDGVTTEEIYRWSTRIRRLHPRWLRTVTLPEWREELYSGRKPPRHVGIQELRRQLGEAAPRVKRTSPWCRYDDGRRNYAAGQQRTKMELVAEFLREAQPASVLDIGCNSGTFSALAARSGARVVAIDSDAIVAGRVWRNAFEHGLNITPLVVDILRPSPHYGWDDAEEESFLSRSDAAFDAVFVLAILHHLLASGQVSFSKLFAFLSRLTTRFAIVEFIAPEDPVFAALCYQRGIPTGNLTRELFLSAVGGWFEIVRRATITPTRTLYTMTRK
jgi:SAM-dependent methyltransferase